MAFTCINTKPGDWSNWVKSRVLCAHSLGLTMQSYVRPTNVTAVLRWHSRCHGPTAVSHLHAGTKRRSPCLCPQPENTHTLDFPSYSSHVQTCLAAQSSIVFEGGSRVLSECWVYFWCFQIKCSCIVLALDEEHQTDLLFVHVSAAPCLIRHF